MEQRRLIAVIAWTQRVIALLVAFSVLSLGCSSTAVPTPPLPLADPSARMSIEEARAKFGTLAVATDVRRPNVDPLLERPASRWKAMGRGAAAGSLGIIAGGAQAGPYGLVLGLLISPLTTIVGTIAGAVHGTAPEEIERAVSALEEATREAHLQLRLRELIIGHLSQEHYGSVVPLDDATTANEEIDTVMDVWISDISLKASTVGYINPILALSLLGNMRLLRKGVEVESVSFSSSGDTGDGHRLLAWAADDAKSFKEGIAQALENISREVVSELLSRVPRRVPGEKADCIPTLTCGPSG